MQTPKHHEEASNSIFAAVAKITQSPNLGVAAPCQNEEGKNC
jgi:hypothetical protein